MARKRKGRALDGWLVLDKPQGLTSTQALGKARRLLDAQKAGHGGTLDPLATGVLPIAFGAATKTVEHAMSGRKAYTFTVRWGEQRDTDDSEGAIIAENPHRPNATAIHAALPPFIGEILQRPPRFSALKVDGARAYALARDGVEVELTPRIVHIHQFALIDQPDADHARFEVSCGKGTYVRSLARDLAVALGTVGHVSSLRRTAVGPFTIDAAFSLEALERMALDGGADKVLLPVTAPLDDLPVLALNAAEAYRLRNGQPVGLIRRQDLDRLDALLSESDTVVPLALATEGRRPIAIVRVEGAEVRPVRMLGG